MIPKTLRKNAQRQLESEGQTRREDILNRILEKCIAKPGPLKTLCWEFQGGDSGDGRGGGYGRISVGSRMRATHRVVATHYFGYIPAEKQVDHKCGNRACCNPAHLEIVSNLENQRRRARRNKP